MWCLLFDWLFWFLFCMLYLCLSFWFCLIELLCFVWLFIDCDCWLFGVVFWILCFVMLVILFGLICYVCCVDFIDFWYLLLFCLLSLNFFLWVVLNADFCGYVYSWLLSTGADDWFWCLEFDFVLIIWFLCALLWFYFNLYCVGGLFSCVWLDLLSLVEFCFAIGLFVGLVCLVILLFCFR